MPRIAGKGRRARLLALALIFLPLAAQAAEPSSKRLRAQVTGVFDGSSFLIGGGLRSSLIGVAAPRETARGGREAAVFLRRLLEGRSIWLEIDEELVDAYGQAQYYVFLEDGTFVNVLMLVRGLGRAVVKHPNVRYRDRLIEAESTAKAFRRGIWGDEFPDPERPEEPPWRRPDRPGTLPRF